MKRNISFRRSLFLSLSLPLSLSLLFLPLSLSSLSSSSASHFPFSLQIQLMYTHDTFLFAFIYTDDARLVTQICTLGLSGQTRTNEQKIETQKTYPRYPFPVKRILLTRDPKDPTETGEFNDLFLSRIHLMSSLRCDKNISYILYYIVGYILYYIVGYILQHFSYSVSLPSLSLLSHICISCPGNRKCIRNEGDRR